MMRTLLKVFLPYSFFVGLGLAIWFSNVRPREATRELSLSPESVNAAGVPIDPVCHMEVNPAWGFEFQHAGHTYHFCAKACRTRFAESPDTFLGDRCIVCKGLNRPSEALTATYLGKSYRLCSDAHRREFKVDPAAYFMHSMWGIPTWMYYTSIAAVLVVSFGLFELLEHPTVGSAVRTVASAMHTVGSVVGTTGALVSGPVRTADPTAQIPTALRTTTARPVPLGRSVGAAAATSFAPPALIRTTGASAADRIDLLQSRMLTGLVTSRVFRFVCQAGIVALFFVIIAAGLFGNQNPALNIAPILTWTVWWGGLVILILFAGKAWCYVCPWDAVAGWLEKLRLWTKTSDGLGLNLKWPRALRNITLATVLFVGLTWIELGFGVTMKPCVTAYLALAMLVMAVVSAFLFERKGFCRYACLVGRVSGLYAMFSGAEIRARDPSVCRTCAGKECVHGSDTAYGCPTSLFPGSLNSNTYCIQCCECLQACPEQNLTINLRPWGADLVSAHRPRTDEAYLALLMLSITGFHGLTMTPNWARMTGWLTGQFSLSHLVSFSLGMTLLMLAPILVYAALVGISYRLGAQTKKRAGSGHGGTRSAASFSQPATYHGYFVRYAYALLPIALFYHLAHNMEHLLMEGPKVVALLSDPFGWNWNLFGTAGWTIPPLVSLDVLWIAQIALVLVGHVYSLWVAQRTSLRLFGDRQAAFRSQLPMLIGMIAFSVFSLWLLKQPMEMRTSAM